MPSLKAIRRRIVSVKNTQKITRAMKMVATARLRRAQQSIVELRPYADKTHEVLSSVAARAADEAEEIHPLLVVRPEQRVLLVVLTSDRGLAGAFNTNINRAAFRRWKELEKADKETFFGVIGRKGRDFFRRRDEKRILFPFENVFEKLNFDKSGDIAAQIIEAYSGEKLDSVYLVYNEFKSAISQKVVVERVLPIVPLEVKSDETLIDFVYEPNKRRLLDRLLPLYVQIQVHRALLESIASEHGARMTAMDNATRNASDLVSDLTLQFNRARQAAITKELMEIIGGAEALKS